MLHLMSLLGAKRTWSGALHMSAHDPKRTQAASVIVNVRQLLREALNRIETERRVFVADLARLFISLRIVRL